MCRRRNGTQDMNMDSYEEDMLYDEEEKYDDDIDKQEFECEGLRRSSRESIPVEILELKWDNEKPYLK